MYFIEIQSSLLIKFNQYIYTSHKFVTYESKNGSICLLSGIWIHRIYNGKASWGKRIWGRDADENPTFLEFELNS